MITTDERDKLKEVLGGSYTSKVLDQLLLDKKTNKNGDPHSANMVRVVFAGQRSHKDIEAAIFKVYKNKLSELKAEQKTRAKILNKKPLAATKG